MLRLGGECSVGCRRRAHLHTHVHTPRSIPTDAESTEPQTLRDAVTSPEPFLPRDPEEGAKSASHPPLHFQLKLNILRLWDTVWEIESCDEKPQLQARCDACGPASLREGRSAEPRMAADQYGPDAKGFLAGLVGPALNQGGVGWQWGPLPSTGQSGSATDCDPGLVTGCVSGVHQRSVLTLGTSASVHDQL